MCIAVAAKIIEIDSGGKSARASVFGNELNINVSLVSPKVGDYVLVHAGCAIEIIKKEMADEITELYLAMEELAEIG